jgi:deoxyribodipyrimidine photolyase-related protein
MNHAALIFPHQLYEKILFQEGTHLFLVEDSLYFSQYNFHKQKLVLHRASMKYYEQYLQQAGYRVTYIDCFTHKNVEDLLKHLSKDYQAISYVDTTDYLLERRLSRYAAKHKLHINKIASPNFLLQPDEFKQQLGKGKKYFMASFYIQQRKKFSILVEPDGEPTGGKWSFDEENRKKLPSSISIPAPKKIFSNKFIAEAIYYVDRHFTANYGSTERFPYATTHEEAKEMLVDFLTHRMRLFGDYEDAIARRETILFHSVLTPALNIGLLSPQQIIDITFALHKKYQFPLNSLEGFIRQIIGWREFMRGVYSFESVKVRTTNFFGFTRKIPASFWKGTTGIEPVDNTIKKVLATGYCHHIERLMVLGNFMLLCEFDPDEVYRWFMELFIDAYDWVMVPNVYSMSQYADGGLITTKPYVSGSNYILKMSDYTKGSWCEVWDGLYWRFMYKNQEIFKKNPRMSMMVSVVNNMERGKLEAHLSKAQDFLNHL